MERPKPSRHVRQIERGGTICSAWIAVASIRWVRPALESAAAVRRRAIARTRASPPFATAASAAPSSTGEACRLSRPKSSVALATTLPGPLHAHPGCLAPASRPPSRPARKSNPHSARCPAGAKLPATSCLGASWTPAPECEAPLVIPASKNLHRSGHHPRSLHSNSLILPPAISSLRLHQTYRSKKENLELRPQLPLHFRISK